MAEVKKVNRYKKTIKTKNSFSSDNRERKILTKKKFKPLDDLHRYTLIVYGEKKIGKTTLLSQFPNTYSFMFEPNDSYELYKDDIIDWQDFLDLVPQFLAGKHDYESCCIDNGRNCYELALDFVCKRLDIEHPAQQNDYGQTWAEIYKEFSTPIKKLMQSQYGFAVTCHQTEKDIETRTGRTFVQVMPDLSSAAARLFCGEIYNIFYYHYEGTDRFLQIIGDDYITAGHRMKGHFLTTKGELIHRIPMGENEEEAYENLIIAYNNKQKDSCRINRKEKSKTTGSLREKKLKYKNNNL